MWIAWHLPRRLVYWCTIRVATHEPKHLTQQEFIDWEIVPSRRFTDGLRLWTKVE